jgi:hypothetical protein
MESCPRASDLCWRTPSTCARTRCVSVCVCVCVCERVCVCVCVCVHVCMRKCVFPSGHPCLRGRETNERVANSSLRLYFLCPVASSSAPCLSLLTGQWVPKFAKEGPKKIQDIRNDVRREKVRELLTLLVCWPGKAFR